MTTPIARLELAIAGRWKMIGNILQAVFGKPKGEEQIELLNAPPDPEGTAHRLMAAFKRRRAASNRAAKKPKHK